MQGGRKRTETEVYRLWKQTMSNRRGEKRMKKDSLSVASNERRAVPGRPTSQVSTGSGGRRKQVLMSRTDTEELVEEHSSAYPSSLEVTDIASSSSDENNDVEIVEEIPGNMEVDEEMMQWTLRTLQKKYLSDSENENEEKEEKSAVRVRCAKAKRKSRNRVNRNSTDIKLKEVRIVVQRIEESTDPEVRAYCTRLKVNSSSVDMMLKEGRFEVQCLEESTDPEVQAYCTHLKASSRRNGSAVPMLMAASSSVIPSAITIKDVFSLPAAAHCPEDPVKSEPMDWCVGDIVFPKTECSTTLPSHDEINVFEEPMKHLLEESALSPVSTKDEPPFSSSSSMQNAEDPLEDSAFEPKTEYSDIDVFEEPIKHLLEESALSPVSTKDEPPFSSSSSMQNAEDPLEDSAFEPKTEYSDIDVFEEPIKHLLEESALSPLSTKDEPPFSSSSSMQNAEDPLEDSAFEPKTEYSDIDVFEEPIKHLLEESASSPLSTKDEPPFSSSSSMQNAEDPLEDSAFEPKTEYSDIDVFEEPIKHLLEESASSPLSTKDEPPFSSSSSMQKAEDPLEDSAFEPKTEYSDIDVFEEPIKHLLEESTLSPVSKYEPPFSPSSSMQNAEDPLEDSAFEPKTEYSDIDVFEEPIKHLLEESTLSPVSKDEPPFSPSSSMQNAEDPLEDSAFQPKTEYSDIDVFEEPIKHLLEESTLSSVSKDEPPFSPSSSMQNAEDPLEDSAFEPKTECSATPPSHAGRDAVDEPIKDPLEESASACLVPVAASPLVGTSAVTIEEELPLSPSAAALNTEVPMEESAFEPMDCCGGDSVLHRTEYSTTAPPSDNDAFSQSAFAEPVNDSLGLTSLQTESMSLPSLSDCIITPSNVKRKILFTRAIRYEAITVMKGKDRNKCAVDQFSSEHSEAVTKIPLVGVRGAELQEKVEALMTQEVTCPENVSVDDSDDESEDDTDDESEDDWDTFLASVPPPRSPTKWKVRASTAEEDALFRAQETARCKNYRRAFTYRLHGYESVVGPARRTHFATRVYDAVARLPNGVGSLADILQLLSDSQFVKISQPWSASLVSKVAGELAMLSLEDNPCLCYNAKHKMCIYLHRNLSEEEIESLYSQKPSTSEASKSVGSCDMKDVDGDHAAESLFPCGGPPALLPQADTLPSLPCPGNRKHPSDNSPYPDPNDSELQCSSKKCRVVTDSEVSAVVVTPAAPGKESCVVLPAAFGEKSSVTTSGIGVPSSSSSSVTILTSSVPSSSSSSSAMPFPVTTLASSVVLSSPASTLGNGMLSSSSFPSPTPLADGALSSPCLPGAQSLLKPGGTPALPVEGNELPTVPSSGEWMHPSNSSPQPVHIEPNGAEQGFIAKNLPIAAESDGSAIVIIPTAFGKEPSVTAAVSSSSRTTLTDRISNGLLSSSRLPNDVLLSTVSSGEGVLPLSSTILSEEMQLLPSSQLPTPAYGTILPQTLFATTLPNGALLLSSSPTTFTNAATGSPSPPLSTLPATALTSEILSSSTTTTIPTTAVLANGVLSSSASPSATLPGAEPLRNKTAAMTDKNWASALHSQAASAYTVEEFFSTSVEPVQPVRGPSDEELRKVVPVFLTRLWTMVEDPDTDDVIQWSDDGVSVVILNEKQFAEQILMLYYGHQNMFCFLKMLDIYGFSKKRDVAGFYHWFFVKRKPQLLYYIEKKPEVTSLKFQDPGLAVSAPSNEKLQVKLPFFLTKLWNIVDRMSDDSVCWSSDGSSFIIHDAERFCVDLLPTFYEHEDMLKFLIELKSYGFHKIQKYNEEADCYEPEFIHKWFVERRPHLLFYMRDHKDPFVPVPERKKPVTNAPVRVKRRPDPYLHVLMRGKTLPFVSNLWNMVEDPESDDVICWGSDGASFLIRDTRRFAAEILPLYYEDLNMYDFLLEMYSYKFKRLEKITEEFIPCERQYTHCRFEKDRPDLLSEIRK